LVHPWFRAEEPARPFPATEPLAKTAKALNRYAPDVIVASPGVLTRLAQTDLKIPRRAIIAVQGPGTAMLREAERELLWKRFKVPVFQQLRGFQGELLAAECDAQVGFHVNAATAHWETYRQELLYTSLFDLRHPVLRLATGWYGDLETSRCGCGCLSARLFPYERQTLRPRPHPYPQWAPPSQERRHGGAQRC
jgi:phenylacetate-coenzyme A ligase PaaK-like adenylate-forming protein